MNDPIIQCRYCGLSGNLSWLITHPDGVWWDRFGRWAYWLNQRISRPRNRLPAPYVALGPDAARSVPD